MNDEKDNSVFATRLGAMTLASILVQRLGGKVVVTQADFDAVAYTRLVESNEEINTGKPDREALTLWIEQPSKGAMQ